MQELFNQIWADIYWSTLLILVGAIVAAGIINFITTRIVARLVRKTKTTLDDDIIAAIRWPLFCTTVLVGAGIAVHRLTEQESALRVMDGIAITAGSLLWGGAGMKIATRVLEALAGQERATKFIQPRTQPAFEILIKTIVVGVAAYIILLAWKVDVTAWLASAGVLGIAVGFAAKDTLGNMISGIFILADAPYKLGDYIILDSGERGEVTDIGIRTTRLKTRDDIEIIIPNAVMANAKIVNESGGPWEMERVRINLGVAYGSDIDQVHQVLTELADQSRHFVKEPAPRIRFRNFGDSALEFQLMGWIEEPALRGRCIDELLTTIYKRFAKEGIQIPFPQRDVHLHRED